MDIQSQLAGLKAAAEILFSKMNSTPEILAKEKYYRELLDVNEQYVELSKLEVKHEETYSNPSV